MRGTFMLFRLLSMLLRGFGGGRLMGGGMRRGGCKICILKYLLLA